MYDADGRHRSGLFTGNRYWIGAAEQCREIKKDFMKNLSTNNNTIQSKIPPFQVTVNSANIKFQILDFYGEKNFVRNVTTYFTLL